MAGPARRQARTLALQALYESDTTGHSADAALARMLEAEEVNAPTRELAESLLRGVNMHRSEIDRLLAEAAPQRPVEDIAAIDRNVLRLAIYEVVFDNRAPVAAVLNEAVALAKRFGSESSGRFVNGVLRTIAGSATGQSR
ncbi:MAG TPA: transcription antitermination factor NusB [Dehalococcoidia bacterium]|nr:transcription antitermination factor NusB [Dehalococcoidia bacterium]